MSTEQDPKAVSGTYAANLVADGMAVGLGTGSTARFAILRLGERVKEGLNIVAIPTSEASATLAKELGIKLVGFNEVNQLDITIDGADEIDADFNMLKGGGGALLREKVVASITKRQICIVDPNKVVEKLGKFPLPVEVVKFGWEVVANRVTSMGGKYTVRQRDGQNYVTDNGNYILDCDFYPIENAPELEKTLKMIPGVVEVGLFINLAHTLIMGHSNGECTVRERQ
ncbi:MAG: ribose-5-phosphate isomerase RpiA [Blastocatellia bacterium]|nr:ribose-5-phosphate isomerase RpiA [Blastocatellia bacterium]MBL8193912.1 ribose-5-phosphate isomerase RpiA [Blastocatellia bacterium]MBN8722487.1 ribose-5-phosphate isomerase RpiA [Acidobacteriota bacterium]